jgi:hypothetical protein
MPWEKSKGRKRLRRQHKVSPMEAQLVAGMAVPLEKAKQYSLEERCASNPRPSTPILESQFPNSHCKRVQLALPEGLHATPCVRPHACVHKSDRAETIACGRERAYKGSLEDAWRNDKRPDPSIELAGRWKDASGLKALEYRERDALEEAMSIEFERSVGDREGLSQRLLTSAGSGAVGRRMVDEKGTHDDLGYGMEDNDDEDEFNVPSELMGQSSSTPAEKERVEESKRKRAEQDVSTRSKGEGGREEAEGIQMRWEEDEEEGEQDYSGGLKIGNEINNDGVDGMFVCDFGPSSEEGGEGARGEAGDDGEEEQGDDDHWGSPIREGGAGHRRGVQGKGGRGRRERHEAGKGAHDGTLPSRSGIGFRRKGKGSMALRQGEDAQESSVGSADAGYEHLKPPPLDQGWQRMPASDGGNKMEQENKGKGKGKGKLEVSYDASLAKDDDDWGDDPEMNEIQNILDEAGYDPDAKVGDSGEEGEGAVSEGVGDGEENVEHEFIKSGGSSEEQEEDRGAGGKQVAGLRDDEEDVSDWVKANPEVARFYGVRGIGGEESSSSEEERRLASKAAKEAKEKKREWRQLRKAMRDNSGMGDFGDGEYDDDEEQQRGSESQQSDSSGDNKLGSLADGEAQEEFLKK